MKRVLVFKTSVDNGQQVRNLKAVLDRLIDKHERWNFDLEDCDRILRVESACVQSMAIMLNLHTAGFSCEELAD